ncbi:uncharacterized protein SPSK_06217 [Sporothrix schenckii 1099-18]|uniref:Integral membrane protein n=2 Tax=Sporothrix schenckii TaxID=29908 RepID=U7PR20_SPOS1|nr:uncharacterized protein SPSK_06217 [Sporothrix schenckii 1099-18]ERS98098.1 hypothetical protein HMPREF1624_04877 [Sporothrix schenckii ATCC 58251]KJR89818.1 hypothetical protein SPSK_06217 [Sporothrix schenckii 1099-18]
MAPPIETVPAEKPDPLPIAQELTDRAVDRPLSETPSGCLTFVKQTGGDGLYRPERPTKLRNSLLAGVGFLELANAGDFAANVWNEIPVPVHAIVLMALGASVALGILYFAVQDARLSWANVCGLRAERRHLHQALGDARRQHGDVKDKAMVRTLACLLDVNFRETGTELVDRLGMDVCMGFGALTVGVGTFMAIGGANRNVFFASNLLSGYVGNAPCALYGLANLFWSLFVWRRAHRHRRAGATSTTTTTTTGLAGGRIEQMLQARVARVQLHSALNGVTGVVAGAASLVTATMWWGYVVLIPCIASSVLANYIWRHRIGYQRPLAAQQHAVVSFDEESTVAELAFVDASRRRWRQPRSSDPFAGLVAKPDSISCVVEFIVRNRLFEAFCLRVLADAQVCALTAALVDTASDTVTIRAESLAAVTDDAVRGRLIDLAWAVMTGAAPKCFRDQENALLEVLGCLLCRPVDANEKPEAPVVAEDPATVSTTESSVGLSTSDGLAGPHEPVAALEQVVVVDATEQEHDGGRVIIS